MNALTFDIVFLSIITICAVLYWFTLVGDVIEDRNKLARARKNRNNNNYHKMQEIIFSYSKHIIIYYYIKILYTRELKTNLNEF